MITGGLKIEVIPVGMLEVNCIIVYDASLLEGILIDPGDEPERILSAVSRKKVTLTSIVLTHGHGDHIGGVEFIRKQLALPVAIGRHDAAMLTSAVLNLSSAIGIEIELDPADRLLIGGDQITVGSSTFRVLHTPGHTPGSISLACGEHVIVGDLIFAGSIGRTDFPGGSFDQLIGSIRREIMVMPDSTKLYPGHGPATTVGVERRTNPFLTGAF